MARLVSIVFLCALSWVSAYPNSQQALFLEDVQGRTSRIVSGWEASEGQFPFQLSLRTVNPQGIVSGCGATLIDNEWALTAAHCIDNQVTVVIRAGSISLNHPVLLFEASDFYIHPLFISGLPFVQPNDIGLIKLGRFVEYTDVIKPVRLQPSADRDMDYSGVRLLASGWGLTWTSGTAPAILNWVYLRGESNVRCREAFGGSNIVADSTVCAGGYNVSSQSICQGDSGGPLVMEDTDGQLTQIGISSFVSQAGCHVNLPAGFVRPGHYHDWISETIGKSLDWVPTVDTIYQAR